MKLLSIQVAYTYVQQFRALVVTGLVVTGLVVTGLDVAGLVVTGLDVAGLGVAGLGVAGLARDELLLRTQLVLLHNTLIEGDGTKTWPLSTDTVCERRDMQPAIYLLKQWFGHPTEGHKAITIKRQICSLVATLQRCSTSLSKLVDIKGAKDMRDVVERVCRAARNSPVPKLVIRQQTPPNTPVKKKRCRYRQPENQGNKGNQENSVGLLGLLVKSVTVKRV